MPVIGGRASICRRKQYSNHQHTKSTPDVSKWFMKNLWELNCRPYLNQNPCTDATSSRRAGARMQMPAPHPLQHP